MRYLLMHRDDASAEKGFHHSTEVSAQLAKLSQEMMEAGVLLSALGLEPTAEGVRLTFPDGVRTATDGPFDDDKPPFAGLALVEVASKEEAVGWATRFAEITGAVEFDIRQVVDLPPGA
jgi:hypothetical protein